MISSDMVVGFREKVMHDGPDSWDELALEDPRWARRSTKRLNLCSVPAVGSIIVPTDYLDLGEGV